MGATLKLALVATVVAFAGSAAAQVEDPYYDPNAPVGQPSDYPPPDPNAYQYQPQAVPQYQQFWYMGAHPVPYDMGNGFCYHTAGHAHQYAPFDQYLFRESGGYYYFIGDPGDFGYTMQMWGYSGEHPIPVAYGSGYCYMTWPHRHPYAPPSSVYFSFVGGYYRYSGPWDPYYYHYRTYYSPYYSGYYRNNYYGGRYWSVRPAPVYRVGAPGVVVGAPHGTRPGVVVGPPRPGVTVGAPGVGVHVGAPPRYHSPGVTVGPPRPARVYQPAPMHVAPPPRAYSPAPMHVPAPRMHTAPMHVAPPRMAPRPSFGGGGGVRVGPPPAFRR